MRAGLVGLLLLQQPAVAQVDTVAALRVRDESVVPKGTPEWTTTTVRLYDAAPGCPCIATDHPKMQAWRAAMIERNATCLVTDADAAALGDDAPCYPPDYGAGACRLWDAGRPPECAFRTPNGLRRRRLDELQQQHGKTTTVELPPPSLSIPYFCHSSWCWVDGSTCDRPSAPAHSPPASTVGLEMSYETCGNVDSYTPRLFDTLRNRTLRVAFPSDSSAIWPLLTLEDGTKAGAAPDLLRYAADMLNMTLEIVPLSNRSTDKFASSWTACVHAVAIGDIDVCGATAWITLERRSLAPFSEVFETDEIYLISRKSDRKVRLSAAEVLSRPFLPFTPAMWGLIFACCAFTSVAFWIVETNCKPSMRTFAKHVYLGYFGYLSGQGPSLEVTTAPARVLQLGWGFFLLVLMSTYTAKLAAFFAVDTISGTVSSLGEAMRLGLRTCIPTSISEQMVATYPRLRNLAVPVDDNTESLLHRMDTGDCDVCVFYPDGFVTEQVKNPRHCDKAIVGMPVLFVGRGFAIRPDLSFSFTALTNQLFANGVWAYLREDNMERHSLGPLCAVELDAGDDDNAVPLGVDELGGNAAILLIVTAASLIVWGFWHGTKGFRTTEPIATELKRLPGQTLRRVAPAWNRPGDAGRSGDAAEL